MNEADSTPDVPRPGRLALLRAASTRQDALRVAGALGPTALALGIQFAAFAVTARGLGVAQFGVFAMILGFTAIGVELVGLGGGDLLIRAVSRDRDRFPAYFGNMLVLGLLTIPPVLIVGFLVVRLWTGETLDDTHLVLALFGEILIGRVASSTELVMIAHGHVIRASMIRLATALARLGTATGYFLLSTSLGGWIEIVALQSVLLSGLYLVLLHRLYGAAQLTLVCAELRSGGAFAVNQVSRAAQGNLDRVVLSRFADDATLGAYAAGGRLVQLGLFPIQVVTRMLYPKFFVHGEKGLAASRAFAVRCVPLMLATGIVAGVMVAAAGFVLPSVLGTDFADAQRTALLLSIAVPFIALQYLGADALTGAGLQHVRAVIFGIAAIGFGLLLALGAAAGGMTGLILMFIFLHIGLAAALWITAFVWRDPVAPANKNRSIQTPAGIGTPLR